MIVINYLDLLNNSLINHNTLTEILLMIGFFLLLIIFLIISCILAGGGEGVIFVFPIAIILFIGLLSVDKNINKNILKSIQCTTTIETKQIKPLPYQYVNNDSSVFLVDEKDFPTIKTKDTISKEDSHDNPYIIVEKVTYSVPKKWYISNKSVDYINSEVNYILKEIHY